MVELEENVIDDKTVIVDGGGCDISDKQTLTKFRADTQNHTKRIKDLFALAQESRIRIDALLGKRTRAPSDLEDNYRRPSNVKRGSIEYDSDERNNRRGSRSSDEWRVSRDVERDRRGSREQDRDRSYGQSERDRRESRDQMNEHREQTGHIITCTNPSAVVEVGGVSLTNKEIDMNSKRKENDTGAQHVSMESNAAINMNAPPAVAKKPPVKKPALAKSPFKFGTISLQVKLED